MKTDHEKAYDEGYAAKKRGDERNAALQAGMISLFDINQTSKYVQSLGRAFYKGYDDRYDEELGEKMKPITVVFDDDAKTWAFTRFYDQDGKEINADVLSFEIVAEPDGLIKTIKVTFPIDSLISRSEFEKRNQ